MINVYKIIQVIYDYMYNDCCMMILCKKNIAHIIIILYILYKPCVV